MVRQMVQLTDKQRLDIEIRSHKTEAEVWRDIHSQSGLDLSVIAARGANLTNVKMFMDLELWRKAFFEWPDGETTAVMEIIRRYNLKLKVETRTGQIKDLYDGF